MSDLQRQPAPSAAQLDRFPLSEESVAWLKSKIRDVPDFPKPGIVFKDITTLLKDAKAFAMVIDVMTEKYRPLKPAYIAGIEARGFILASTLAYRLGAGFVPIRKPGKLPYKVERQTYSLEYGQDAVEIHIDAVEPGSKTILIDDLLATGGTAAAAHALLGKLGADIQGMGFVTELSFLAGRAALPSDVDVFSIIRY